MDMNMNTGLPYVQLETIEKGSSNALELPH